MSSRFIWCSRCLFCSSFLSGAGGDRGLIHWSMRNLSNLCHVNFLELRVFCQHQSQLRASSASTSFFFGEKDETILQRHLPQANPFLETCRESSKNPQRLRRDTNRLGRRHSFAKVEHTGSHSWYPLIPDSYWLKLSGLSLSLVPGDWAALLARILGTL